LTLAIARIDRVNLVVNALITRLFDEARAAVISSELGA
jgi:hypothetical protein